MHERRQYNPRDGRFWRLSRHMRQHGNYYPTHGLVPAGCCLDINRGDRFEYLVAMESRSAGFEEFGRMNFPPSDWRHSKKMGKGDVTMCLMRTVNGRQIVLKHDVCNPCPYDRGSHYIGSKGIFRGITFPETAADAYTMGSPCRFGWIEKPDGEVENFFGFDKAMKST